MATFTASFEMETIVCCICNQPFGVLSRVTERLREYHNDFYCPAGHSQHFTAMTEAEKLRVQRNDLERKLREMEQAELERKAKYREAARKRKLNKKHKA